MVMKNDKLELFDPSQRLLLRSPISKNRILQANIRTTKVQCLSTTVTDQENWLWHLRFGHLNFRSLSQLHSNEMVIGLPKICVSEKINMNEDIGEKHVVGENIDCSDAFNTSQVLI